MSNIEWKNGYDAGFTAGWKAAKADTSNHTNYSSVYHSAGSALHFPTMIDSLGIVGETTDSPCSINTTTGYETVTLTEFSKAAKISDLNIHNLTDHTRIV